MQHATPITGLSPSSDRSAAIRSIAMVPTTESPIRHWLRPGAVMGYRTRCYLVEEVWAPRDPGDDTLVSLTCLGNQLLGQRLTVVPERELDFELLGESSWELVS